MASKAASIGSSLLVPCVQELAKDPLVSVPPRYIRYDQEHPIIASHDPVPDVPVIDLQRLLDQETMDSELGHLHLACKTWGFFQLVNHGVSSSLLDKLKTELQDFFNLPMEEKKRFWQFPGEIEGFGQAFVVSEEQKLDWGDLFFMVTQPAQLRKPHLFPKLPLPFRDTLESYSLEVKNLASAILEQMGKALNIKAEEMRDFTEGIRQSMRMNYYPQCPQPEQVIGLTPHSDATGLTILLQVNEVEGLQLRKDEKWVPVKPLPNAFVVNVGDILEIVTNGAYRSIEHRATVNSKKERLSIASFHSPRFDGNVCPVPSLVTEQTPALFKEVTVQEYFQGLFSRMRRDGLRVAIEAWNQCNEVGEEAVDMGSPRMADCFDVDHSTSSANLIHKVSEDENRLGLLNGTYGRIKTRSYDRYAPKKELYLGKKCQVKDFPRPWQFWMIMLKSGNMDTLAARCPENGKKSEPFAPESRFPCFGEGCMNMPKMYHNYTGVHGNNTLRGSFYGTWDLDANVKNGVVDNSTSYFNVTWQKELGKGSWVFHHYLKTSSKYPWLMLYLRSDATKGFSGGYHYRTRGMSKIVPKSPNFKVKFKLTITQGGGPRGQFYLMDIGSCWKNDGSPCNGDVRSDVTRYSEMVINPDTESWCSPEKVAGCPPYHTFPNGTRVHRTNNASFPFDAYHMYCAPGNALHLEEPYNLCDAYSNPQPQEILQIIPHPVWGHYGYPTKKGEGWIGDPRSWELDVGKLSQSLYFYQDPGTKPVERHWPSIDLGTEIYISNDQVAEWTVSDFDILVPKDQIH